MGKWREEARVSAADVTGLSGRVAAFLKPYLKLFERREQRAHAEVYVEGRWRQLSRRTLEPIATERGLRRRPLQHFVGAGKWDDGLLRDEQCRQVAAEMGSSDGVLIMDGSGFQKAGPESVGTQRQWLGRLGKEEQCQVGEFLAYAAKGSVALVDCELYLPEAKERRILVELEPGSQVPLSRPITWSMHCSSESMEVSSISQPDLKASCRKWRAQSSMFPFASSGCFLSSERRVDLVSSSQSTTIGR